MIKFCISGSSKNRRHKVKIFGIGLSKTGTSSLAHALKLLDYNVKDCLGVTTFTKGDMASIDQNSLSNYNALTDTPIPSFYQELDKKYPASKFILTVRDMDGWLKSCKKQFNQKSADKQSDAQNKLFLDLYGTTVFEEDKFKQSYLSFVEGVNAYFKDRPNDLLIIDIIKGEGWEKLCPFLNKPNPQAPFPKSNVTQIRWLNIHELAQRTRNATFQLHELSENLTLNKSTSTNKLKHVISSFFGLDIANRIDKCANKTQNKITKELFRLNSNIPVISKTNHDIPLQTRASWNHFWLISCSEGCAQLKTGGIGYTINVALIEDGLPYLGIIYIPELDILYYAATDKGAYKMQGNNKPLKIESHHIDPVNSPTSSAENIAKIPLNSSLGIGNVLCQSIEDNSPHLLSIEKSKEWQTAAVHAILKTISLTLVDDTTDTELKYNKSDWTNTSITIDIP